MKASETFHNPAFDHNCAQAVAYKWANRYSNPNTIVGEMKANGGGRAENGLCGALYAAIKAYPEKAEEIKQRFKAKVGDITCKEIKANAKTSCPLCVDIADEILSELIQK